MAQRRGKGRACLRGMGAGYVLGWAELTLECVRGRKADQTLFSGRHPLPLGDEGGGDEGGDPSPV